MYSWPRAAYNSACGSSYCNRRLLITTNLAICFLRFLKKDGWKEQERGSLLAASVRKHRALPPDSKHFVPYPTLDVPCRSSDINSEGGPLSPTLVGSIINSPSVKVRATISATASSKLQKLQGQRSSPLR